MVEATGSLVRADAGPTWDDLGDQLVAETEEWLERLSAKSWATARGYARDLGYRIPVAHPEKGPARSPLLGGLNWWAWLRTRGLNPLAVPEIEVIRWLAALDDAGYATATRARALCSVRSWHQFLVDKGLIEKSPAAGVSAGAQGIRPPEDSPTISLTSAQAVAMIEAADRLQGPMRLRHAATVALLLITGVRIGELCGLAVQDLVNRQGTQKLRVKGKGGKYRPLELADIAWERLSAYLDSRPDLKVVVRRGQAGGRTRIPLLMTRTGKPITSHEVFRLLRRVAALAGLPDEVVERMTPHVTRHTTAQLALQSGANIEEIRLLLGHASIRTTQRYLHASGEQVPLGVGEVLAAQRAADATASAA
ncbi:tyrosine-type recombinase/integrase [Amycolatopsis australiensis]|uniref:Integrase/recombinase XerD n=1 Tax=Amycolatopsis australiensis TaxID=546364 RepID=A0A1K1LPQ1_9PSEU|nr:tyrosine-type recombinase/integrase [Amycolatopsis australiensis]SFW12856.1 integrase/recombinase XerD [Amycolatopsis australiensis]